MILPPDRVDCWHVPLDSGAAERRAQRDEILDEAERTRARRFYFERDRWHFAGTRACLRVLLGRYLDVRPFELTFGYTDRGKPFLAMPQTDLRFNVSHSGGEALLAFARGREIGIDLEAGERLGDDWRGIAKRYFSAREYSQLSALPEPLGRSAFLNGWARKEAYLKATGLGIADGLNKIEVTIAPGDLPVFVSQKIAARWTFCDLSRHGPFTLAAALVAERRNNTEPPPEVRYFSVVSTAALLAHENG